jgi:hypothetical protein
MNLEPAIGMCPTDPIDPTTNNRWLIQHSDRLIRFEYEKRIRERTTAEMFPDELADKIGRTEEYVRAIIKNAISHAKLCSKPNNSRP